MSMRDRDLVGYGPRPPAARWPGGKRVALNFVINYEEGAESSVEHGDARSETINSDNVGAPGWTDRRDFVTESHYDYGARAGYWRLMRLFESRGLDVTVFAVAQALDRNPEVAGHLARSKHEICCHGWRWIDYSGVPETVEAAHMARALAALRKLGKPVTGWYTGRIGARTRLLAAAQDGLLYDSDAYDDDIPYWRQGPRGPWLVIPYSFDCNDMRFATSPGFNSPDEFAGYLGRTLDQLLEEGRDCPKMMSVGLHCRLAGKPARSHALAEFVDRARSRDDVWICRRDEIAAHWHRHHLPSPACVETAFSP